MEKLSIPNTIGALGQCTPEENISMMYLLDEKKKRIESTRQNNGECRNTPLKEFRNIRISQRRCSSRIHNRTAYQTNHRYNHTWIRPVFYLWMRHSSSSHNMEFRHSFFLHFIKSIKAKQGEEEEQQSEIFRITEELRPKPLLLPEVIQNCANS